LSRGRGDRQDRRDHQDYPTKHAHRNLVQTSAIERRRLRRGSRPTASHLIPLKSRQATCRHPFFPTHQNVGGVSRSDIPHTPPRSQPAAPWPPHNGRKPRLVPITLPAKPFDWHDDE
jgi:hypothetical protein